MTSRSWLQIVLVNLISAMSISFMSPTFAKRVKGPLLGSTHLNHILLVLTVIMTVSATWTPHYSTTYWQTHLQVVCLTLLTLALLLGRPYGPNPVTPAVLTTLLLLLPLITPWPLLPLLLPLLPWPPPTQIGRLLRLLKHLPQSQRGMDPTIPVLLLWKISCHYALTMGSPCSGLSLSVLDSAILLHLQRRLVRRLSSSLRYLPPIGIGNTKLAFRVGTLCLLLWFHPPLRTVYWESAKLRSLQVTITTCKTLRAVTPLCLYTLIYWLWLYQQDVPIMAMLCHLPVAHMPYLTSIKASPDTDDCKPTLRLSSVARWSQRRRLLRTLSRDLSPLDEYQLANSYRGMVRMYAPYRKQHHWLPPSPLATTGRGGGSGNHARAQRSSTFKGSYSETGPATAELPDDMRYLKGVLGLGKVGIGTSRLQARFGPGVGSGLFAISKLKYKENRPVTSQKPICSYRNKGNLRITFDTFKSLTDEDCTYVWSQALPRDGTPPPPGWVCIDASDPSSCYGR